VTVTTYTANYQGWLTLSMKVRLLGATPDTYVMARPKPVSGLAVSGSAWVTTRGWATLTVSYVPAVVHSDCPPTSPTEAVPVEITTMARCAPGTTRRWTSRSTT